MQARLIKSELGKLHVTKVSLLDSGHAALQSMQRQVPYLIVSAMYLPDITGTDFDLVVTDYNMPEMDEENLTRFIRERSSQRSIPVLMVTSEGALSRLSAVQQAGVRYLRQTVRHRHGQTDDPPAIDRMSPSASP